MDASRIALLFGHIKPKGDAPPADEPDEGDAPPGDMSGAGVKMAVREFIDAVHAKDTDAATSALRNAFFLMDAEPHEEGPHEQ